MSADTDAVIVRPLEAGDHAEWLRLREALWPHQTPAQNAQEMAAIVANFDRMPAFVAVRPNGGLCGFAEAAIHNSAPGCATDRIGYLEAWYVDPDWRQQGVGRRLVDAVEDWARAQGCVEMASDTDSGYPLSPTAHARLGYEEVERVTAISFWKSLPPEGNVGA